MKLENRLVVVTGASTGIGAATVRRLVSKRPSGVVLIARSEEKLERIAAAIRADGCNAYVYPVDLMEIDRVTETAAAIRADVGEPDVLINNAGAGRWRFLEDTSPDEIIQMTALPYTAAACLTAAFLSTMLERRAGHIVNISSPACFLPWAGATAYSVARWAMRGLSEALQADLAGTGVDVSLVVPGLVKSEYFTNNPGSEERIPGIAKLFRTLDPDEVAEMIVGAVERRRKLVVRPRLLQVTVWWSRHFPWSVIPLVRRTGVNR